MFIEDTCDTVYGLSYPS